MIIKIYNISLNKQSYSKKGAKKENQMASNYKNDIDIKRVQKIKNKRI